MKKALIILLFVGAISIQYSFGQYKVLPISSMPTSTSELALGGAKLFGAEQSLYTNSGGAFDDDLLVAYSMGYMPSNSGQSHHFHNVTSNYNIDASSTILLGVRYFSMGKIDGYWDADINFIDKAKGLHSYSVAAGYARRFKRNFNAYVTMEYIGESLIDKHHNLLFTIGADYDRSSGEYANNRFSYRIGGRVSNIGIYNMSDMLSLNATFGAELIYRVNARNCLNANLEFGGYLASDYKSIMSESSLGFSYCYDNKYALLVGGHIDGFNNNYLSLGLRVAIKSFDIGGSMSLPIADDIKSIYMVSLSHRINFGR